MSQGYAKTTGTSEYFHLDTTGTTAIATDTFAHLKDHTEKFFERHRLITYTT